jgi:hypothetical protein
MPTEEQINQWKQQYSEVYCIIVGEKSYHLRKPSRAEYKRFIDTVTRSTYDAALTLTLACLLDPPKEEFMSEMEINPGLHLQISAELQDRIGGGQAVSSKNL